jgi:hypothetical protein
VEKTLIPNSTQIPNVLLDFLIPQLPEGEGRCLLYICRRTYGFHKEMDRISFSQFVNGIKGKDNGCGCCRSVVAMALKNLNEAGAILVIKDWRGNFYKINLDMDIEGVVRKVNQSRKQTASSMENRPQVVRLPYTQKKGKQRETKTYTGNHVAGKQDLIELLTDYVVGLKGASADRRERYFRPAADLLKLCDWNLPRSEDVVFKISKWAAKNNLNWEIETCFKRFLEIDNLKV